MYRRPWLEVAVKVRAPVADAPIAAESAECSDSTWMYSAFSAPDSTISKDARPRRFGV